MRLTVDEWESGIDRSPQQIDDPTVEDLRRAIESLDQASHTIVGLEDVEGNNLFVGGGLGAYVVTGTAVDGTVRTLRREVGQTEPKVRLVAGGQAGYYAPEHVVELNDAVQGATAFMDASDLPPNLMWEHQSPE